MNSSKKTRCHGAFPRVRKRNSTSNKPTSYGAHNATLHHASLIKNNKSLAVTLQETRCELSTYRNLFEESLEYMSKAKLAKSKMMQLSTSLKDFIRAFDESLLLLECDSSKWPNIKSSTQSNKNIPKGLNPVVEVANEMEEILSTDQEMNCNEENNTEYSDQVFETASNPPRVLQKEDIQNTVDKETSKGNFEMSRKSPKKKTEKLIQNNSDSQTKNTKGDIKTKAKVLKFSPRKYANSNYLKKMLSSSSSRAAKVTKIPRCQSLSIDMQKQNILKESTPQNKAYKLKSPEKKCEELNSDFPRRKTFVIKSNNVLENFDSTGNIAEKNNSESIMEETSNISEGLVISKIDKRKTFVKKKPNILKETETTTSDELLLNNDRRKTCVIKSSDSLKTIEFSAKSQILVENEFTTENRVFLGEQTDTEDDVFISKTNRKTFVKKSNDEMVLHQDNNVPEYQTSFPNNASTSINSEVISTLSEDGENFKTSSELQLNMNMPETDHAAGKDKSNWAERVKSYVEDTLLNVTSQAPSNEIKKNHKTLTTNQPNAEETEERVEEMSQNLKSKIDCDNSNYNLTEITYDNVLNRGVIFSDDSLRDENFMNKLSKSSPNKSYNSALESADSENEILFIEEINFNRRSALQTPIRRQISKNKKKKFVFDVKKRKSILKKNSICENNNNATSNNENDVNEAKVKNVQFISGELVNAGNSASLQSDSCTVRKRTKKISAKKVINKQTTPIKNKAKDIKVDVDDLIPKPKKIKRRNTKKKKNEDIYFDDNVISKFRENDEVTKSKMTETEETRKELESDLTCEKTGKNTFLVHAEIHPPPPSLNMHDIVELNKENEKLNLQNMQVTVVLDDVLKSKNIDFLNISDRDLLCSRTVFQKTPFSGNSSCASIDPDESIEKLRSDPTPETDDLVLQSDTLLNTSNCDLQSIPVLDAENVRTRRRKEVNYKEPSLHRKMRRC